MTYLYVKYERGEPVHQHVYDAVLSCVLVLYGPTGVREARTQLKEYLPECSIYL